MTTPTKRDQYQDWSQSWPADWHGNQILIEDSALDKNEIPKIMTAPTKRDQCNTKTVSVLPSELSRGQILIKDAALD